MAFLSISILCFEAFGADGGAVGVTPNGAPATPALPAIIKENGKILIDFKDGRIASIFQSIGKVARLSTEMIQTENTCDEAQILSKCQMLTDFSYYEITVRWIKHHDLGKINQIVKYKEFNGSSVNGSSAKFTMKDFKTERGFLMWYTAATLPEFRNEFKPDQIVCDQLMWTKNLPKKEGNLLIHSWGGESMNANDETGVNENITRDGVFGIELKQIDERTLEFVKIGSQANPLSTLPGHIGLQQISLNYVDAAQRQCQLGFGFNFLGTALKKINDTGFMRADEGNVIPLRSAMVLRSAGDFEIISRLKSLFYTSYQGSVE